MKTNKPTKYSHGILLSGIAAINLTMAVDKASAATVLVGGGSWMGGNGVNVYWNNGDCCCGWGYSYTVCPATGASVYTGCEFQCVELTQRLYTTRNWRCGSFGQNANGIYPNAGSYGLTANG